MSYALPRTLTLPSGARTTLRRRARPAEARSVPQGCFGDVIERVAAEIELVQDDREVDLLDMPVGDFHVVRAVLTKAGVLDEEETTFDCHNCGAKLDAYPCARLETGPWEDGEADDEELDATAPFGEKLEIGPIRIGHVRQLRTITLAPRTVREALPLFAALGSDKLGVDETVVKAMGIQALNSVEDAGEIATLISRGGDELLRLVSDLYIEAHYPLRLSADVYCPECKARNRVDAPLAREFEHSADTGRPPSGEFLRSPHSRISSSAPTRSPRRSSPRSLGSPSSSSSRTGRRTSTTAESRSSDRTYRLPRRARSSRCVRRR